MGRIPPRDPNTLEMFEMPPAEEGIVRIETTFQALTSPVWTENKARMIQKYVRFFILITKHGTYIDGFAGPQVERFNEDSWAAKLVLDIQPPWLRRFVLCEAAPDQVAHLQALVETRRASGDKRPIEIVAGDTNVELPKALAKAPVRDKEAAFCLLDQRTFECNWDTVQAVAKHKVSGNKIEIFYFLPVGWLFRSMSGIKDPSKLVRWWGRPDIEILKQARGIHDIAKLFTARFETELGYSSVHAWPIHERSSGGKTMFFMIHAADHPEAPKLMYRAFRQATGALEPMEHTQLELDAAGFDIPSMTR